MERGSTIRVTRVAVSTAGSNGKINDPSCKPFIRTTAESELYIVAARTAAARSSANSVGGIPGQDHDQPCPTTAPGNAPTVRDGVNKLRGVPLPCLFM
jgi:hypothetical protein